MADDEDILVASALVEEFLEVLEAGFGGEGVGEQNWGLVTGLGAHEGGGLEAAFEGAGDYEVELNFQGVEDVGEVEAVAFAFFVEGAFQVEEWVFSAETSAGVAEYEEIHSLFTF